MHKCVHIAHKEFKCECKPGYELDGDKACISELFYSFSLSAGWLVGGSVDGVTTINNELNLSHF